MTKKVKSSPKEKKGTYQDEINNKTLDLIDTVSENVTIQSERIDILNQRLDIISNKLDKVSNRVGIV
jgi:uncharacterized coiled-coil protein SlyX